MPQPTNSQKLRKAIESYDKVELWTKYPLLVEQIHYTIGVLEGYEQTQNGKDE